LHLNHDNTYNLEGRTDRHTDHYIQKCTSSYPIRITDDILALST